MRNGWKVLVTKGFARPFPIYPGSYGRFLQLRVCQRREEIPRKEDHAREVHPWPLSSYIKPLYRWRNLGDHPYSIILMIFPSN